MLSVKLGFNLSSDHSIILQELCILILSFLNTQSVWGQSKRGWQISFLIWSLSILLKMVNNAVSFQLPVFEIQCATHLLPCNNSSGIWASMLINYELSGYCGDQYILPLNQLNLGIVIWNNKNLQPSQLLSYSDVPITL